MQKLFENWRKYLDENLGTFRPSTGHVKIPYEYENEPPSGEDLEKSVKVVIHDGGNVLLLKSPGSKTWDLPGGHIQTNENALEALHREVREETGLEIFDPIPIYYTHGNKTFYQATFGAGEPNLGGEEHEAYGRFNAEQIEDMRKQGLLSEPFYNAIMVALGLMETSPY